MNDAQKKREDIKRLEALLATAQADLVRLETQCRHQWLETYDPEHTPAYTIPGDEPGTMGVDWQGPCPVPAKTTDRWKRTCQMCGKTETTNSSTNSVQVTKTPKF